MSDAPFVGALIFGAPLVGAIFVGEEEFARMTHLRRRIWIVLAVLAVATATRFGASVWWQSRLPAGERFRFGDSHSYWALAGRLGRGESFQFGDYARIFRTPGYPVALAPLFAFWPGGEPPVFAARCIGLLWGVAAVGATIDLGRRLASFEVGCAAGAIAAVQPEAVASSVFILSEATFCLPMLLQLDLAAAAWIAARRAASARRVAALAAFSGACGAAAALMRPGWLLFLPWSIGALASLALARAALQRRRRSHEPGDRSTGDRASATEKASTSGVSTADAAPALRASLWIGLWMTLGLAVGMTPWWWRNYQLTGRFVATTCQVGASLYDGWNPDAQGGSDMRFTPAFIAAQRAEDASRTPDDPPPGTFEERLDERHRRAALDWAREHPGEAVRLAGVKLLRLWNPWPNSQELGGPATRQAIAGAFLPLLAAAAVGLRSVWNRAPAAAVCLLPIGYLTSLHLIFVSSIRYRQPAIFLLAVLAAMALVRPPRGGAR